MRFFEIDLDEDQMKSFVKAIIDEYECGLHTHGTYDQAVEQAQQKTMETIENLADAEEVYVHPEGVIVH